MSTLCCFFSHAPSSNSLRSVSDSQVYSLRILLVSDAALCICSGEDRTAAAINYSMRRTPMPQSLLGSLPAYHQHFSPGSLAYILVLTAVEKKKVSSQLVFTHLGASIDTSDGEQRASRWCHCAILKRDLKNKQSKTEIQTYFPVKHKKGSRLCQTGKD